MVFGHFSVHSWPRARSHVWCGNHIRCEVEQYAATWDHDGRLGRGREATGDTCNGGNPRELTRAARRHLQGPPPGAGRGTPPPGIPGAHAVVGGVLVTLAGVGTLVSWQRRRARPTAPTRWPARTWPPASRDRWTPSASSRSTCGGRGPQPRSTRRPTSRPRARGAGRTGQLLQCATRWAASPRPRCRRARPRPRRQRLLRPAAPWTCHRGRTPVAATGLRSSPSPPSRRVVRRRQRAHRHPGAAQDGRRRRSSRPARVRSRSVRTRRTPTPRTSTPTPPPTPPWAA